jgi:predicted nucleic acid-binding protein
MEQEYLIDTNVLIDVQMGKIPESGTAFIAKIIDTAFNISFVSYIEFLGYRYLTPDSEKFVRLAKVIEIDKKTIDACILLRKASSIKLPDAIIAATAIAESLVLLTHNTKDYKNIDGLIVIDPYEK